jgi:hypothetical protein
VKITAFLTLLGGVAQVMAGLGLLFASFLSKSGSDGAFTALVSVFLVTTGVASLSLSFHHLDEQDKKGAKP